MYKILGSDQKEYGPITGDQVRQWIIERRLHAQSLVRPEGSPNWQPVSQVPDFSAVLAGVGAPPPVLANAAPAQPDSGLSTLVPYKNPRALIAYYLGIFSFIPVVGMFLGITAFILGLQGLKFAGANPQARGRVHAWIGVICGGIFGLLYLILNVMIVVGIIARK